jgi:transposase
MRALETDVVDAVWAAVEPLLPTGVDEHPLVCHRPRVADSLSFRGMLIRLTTGSSWVDVDAIHQVSDTTLRARRDEWIAAGVFEALKD